MNASAISLTSRELTHRLIACVSEGEDMANSAGFQACDKLRRPLSTLMGTLGYRALIMRALTLARRESESLESVRVNDDGSLGEINSEAMKAGTVLAEQLIALLFSFVGEAITLRLLHDVWPGLRGLNSIPGEPNDQER